MAEIARTLYTVRSGDHAEVRHIAYVYDEVLSIEHGGVEFVPVVMCKDCVHYTPDDEFFVDLGMGIAFPAATCDSCDLWAGTKCKTLPDGYCFLGERRVS